VRPVSCVIALGALLTSACSLLPGDDAPTIASLDRRPAIPEDIHMEAGEVQAMAAYRNFLAVAGDTETRPEAMRRLADLNLDAEPYPDDTGADVQSAAVPDRAGDSVRLYRELLAQYPDRAGNDAILYQLARAHERNGEPWQSLAALTRLTAQYPRSEYALEAQFRRGEIHFVQGDYPAAVGAYRAVITAGDGSPFYRQSLYKLGWCYFRQGLFEAALDAFIALLDLALPGGESGITVMAGLPDAERELVEDTLRAMSLSFSRESGAVAVAACFRRAGARDYEDIVYDRLGLLYLQKERYSDAAQTFQAFVDHNPEHRQAPAFQMRVIETYQQGRFPTLVLEGKKAFVERYNLTAGYWTRHNAGDNPQVVEFLKTTLSDLSLHYHALAQKKHRPEDYRQAARWYRSYLDSFSDAAEAPHMNYLLADLLFEQEDFRDAAREYQRTAYDYGHHEQAAAAGYASVLAFEKGERGLEGDARTAWQGQAMENALRFATHFPEHPETLAVLTRTAESLLAAGDTERAGLIARRVIDTGSASRSQQRIAWTVLAHALFDQQDFLQAEQAYREVLARTAADTDDRQPIVERLAAAIYKQGEAAQAAGDSVGAVERFQQVRLATPTASIVATAEFDAAAGLLEQQEWDRAATVLERFREAYPDDPRQDEVTRRLATGYLAGRQPLRAAAEFERIGHRHADRALRREALWQAAELYEQADQPARAITAYEAYVAQFPVPAESAAEAMYRLAEHNLRISRPAERQRWLAAIIETDRQAGAGRTDRLRYLAATARFGLAEAAGKRYRAARLALPLKQSLATKKRLLEAALQQYGEAADYRVAEITTAATCRTAQLYAQLGQALLASERPPNLSGEALEQYNILLEEQAYPFEEKAISLHEANVRRIETGIYNAWIEKSLEALALLEPARYAKLERSASYVEALH
jgi:TolA-binding protein